MTPAKFKHKVKKRQVTASLTRWIIHYRGCYCTGHGIKHFWFHVITVCVDMDNTCHGSNSSPSLCLTLSDCSREPVLPTLSLSLCSSLCPCVCSVFDLQTWWWQRKTMMDKTSLFSVTYIFRNLYLKNSTEITWIFLLHSNTSSFFWCHY